MVAGGSCGVRVRPDQAGSAQLFGDPDALDVGAVPEGMVGQRLGFGRVGADPALGTTSISSDQVVLVGVDGSFHFVLLGQWPAAPGLGW